MSPFIYKRKSYEHEKELRALIQKCPVNGEAIDWSIELFKTGAYIDVDFNTLVQNVYICPTAPDWFYELVVSVIKQYNFDFNVIRSSLNEEPVCNIFSIYPELLLLNGYTGVEA